MTNYYFIFIYFFIFKYFIWCIFSIRICFSNSIKKHKTKNDIFVIFRHCEAQISRETETQHFIVRNVQHVCTVLFKLSLSDVPRRPLLYKRSHALLSVSCRNELRDRKTFSQTKHTKYWQIVQIWFIWFMYHTHPGVTHSLNGHSWRDVHLGASIHGYFGHSYGNRGLEREENIR